MRLLKTEGSEGNGWKPQLVESRGEKYAILSHRPFENRYEEVLYCDIEIVDDGGRVGNSGYRKQQYHRNVKYSHCDLERQKGLGYHKIRCAAILASRERLGFIWIDTCCVDDASSAEVGEAINGSWTRLADAEVCFAFLSDVPGHQCNAQNLDYNILSQSAWWSNCWTLQELLAPKDVVFFNADWSLIGTKKRDLGETIQAITEIDLDIILRNRDVETASIARRMCWASRRFTDRVEDTAYSLIGLFNVSMSICYGEGHKAFYRLQQEIIKDSDDESIFAWRYNGANDEDPSGLLARYPSAFRDAGNIAPLTREVTERRPYSMTNRGLSMFMHMSHVKGDNELYLAALHCTAINDGEYSAIYMKKDCNSPNHYFRVRCKTLAKVSKQPDPRPVYVRQSGHALQTQRVPISSRHSIQSPFQPLSKVSSPDSYAGRQSISEISQLDTIESDRSVRNSMNKASMMGDPQRSRIQLRNGAQVVNGPNPNGLEREAERPTHRSTLSQVVTPDVDVPQSHQTAHHSVVRDSTMRNKLPWRKNKPG